MNLKAKVLVVDNEMDEREMLVLGLSRLGHNVRGARDGKEAIDFFDNSYQVLVTDLIMPRVDGLELLERIKAIHQQIICIVITSFADKYRTIAALNLGADHLIEKPYSISDVAELIERLLERARQQPSFHQLYQQSLSALSLDEQERLLVTLVLKGMANKDIA
jgi:DNA-binding response OmpR family regulator